MNRTCQHALFLLTGAMMMASGSVAISQDFSKSANSLYYRLRMIQESDINKLNRTPLNPDNRLVPQNRYGNYASAGLFLGWRTLTMNLSGSGSYRQRERPQYRLDLRELYLDKSLGGSFQLTLGRKLLKWGTGYAFNPTGVVEPRRDAADPGDRLQRNHGRQIAALDIYTGSTAISVVYANEVQFSDNRLLWGHDELALRYYTFWRGIDFSLIGHLQDRQKSRFGFNFAATRGNHLGLHGEIIAQRGSHKWYHRVLRDHDTVVFNDYPYERPYLHSSKIFYRLLLGAQYSFSPGKDLIIEYYYNREGLTRGEWQRWRKFVTFHQKKIVSGQPDGQTLVNFYNALNTLNREGAMRHYGFLRGSWVRPRDSFEAIALINLNDGSGVLLPTLRRRLNSTFDIWLRFSHFFGSRSSEFGMLFIESSWRFGMGVHL